MATYKGISFPPRIGSKGGWVMSSADSLDTTKIKESIQIIILTMISERVMEYEFGSNTMDAIFENMDVTLVSVLKYKTQQALEKWEQRIRVRDVQITLDTTNSQILIFISYTVLSLQVSDSVMVPIQSHAPLSQA